MTIEDRLQRMEVRQEALVTAISGLTDVMEQTRDLVAELMAWLQEPSSSELPDAIKKMAEEIGGLANVVARLGVRINTLPEDVARAINTGEVP
jgi:ubiquinone biosynthesis protein UbiJ